MAEVFRHMPLPPVKARGSVSVIAELLKSNRRPHGPVPGQPLSSVHVTLGAPAQLGWQVSPAGQSAIVSHAFWLGTQVPWLLAMRMMVYGASTVPKRLASAAG